MSSNTPPERLYLHNVRVLRLTNHPFILLLFKVSILLFLWCCCCRISFAWLWFIYCVCVCVWAAVCTLPPLSPAPRMSAHSERVPNRSLLHYRAHYRVRQSAMAREQMQGCSHGVCSAGPCGLGRSPRNVVGGGWCRNGVSPGAIGYPRLQCVFKYKSMKEIP